MSAIATVALFFLIYKVVKIVGTKDTVLVLMLSFVALSFASYGVAQYLLTNIYARFRCNYITQLCKVHALGNLSQWAQCIAILLNL